MLYLLLLLAMLAAGVAILAAAGTVFVQGYLYSEPVEGIAWRAPAVGAVAGLFFGAWCLIESKAPGRYDVLWNFSTRDEQTFDRFWSERTNGPIKTEVPYRKERGDRGQVVYRDAEGRPWRRSDNGLMTAIIVEDNGQRVRFEAPINSDQTFKLDANEPLKYYEVGGPRIMTEASLGQVSVNRTGLLVGNLLLNAAHLVVWFLAFWLLLEFQWPHALGLAAVFWLLFSVTVWPVLKEHVPRTPTAVAAPVAPQPA